MTLPSPLVLGAIYGISELCLALTRRSRERAASRDRHSLAVLWGVISVSVWLSISSVAWFPHAALPHRRDFYLVGLPLFVRRDFALILDLVSGPLFYGRCIDRGGTTRHRFRPVPFHPASVLHRRADRIRRIRILSQQLDIDPVCDVADCGRVSVAHPR